VVAEWPRWRLVRRLLGTVAAILASVTVLALCGIGSATVPALGPALVPGHGAWASAADAELPRSQQLRLPGLSQPARVSFQRDGFAKVTAATVPDAYLALGYLHARFRLDQMDLQRRLAEGRLAQLQGPSAVPSDRLELRLGLLRTAQREWSATPRSSPAARVLSAYAHGVNDELTARRRSVRWPALFALARVFPGKWTPVDSLAVQAAFTQALTFSTAPLDNALLARSLGAARFAAWFGGPPAATAGAAHGGTVTAASPAPAPIDPGPYPAAHSALPAGPGLVAARGPSPRVAAAAAALLRRISTLRRGQLAGSPGSSAVAVNGPMVADGRSLLAAAPHLAQTIPAVWYQAGLSAPGLAVTGMTIPGLPGVLIGHNAHIAWTLTDTQSQSTLYYVERVSRSRPGSYFWRGRWQRMRQLRYDLPVRGRSGEPFPVYLTAHGPVLTSVLATISVDWAGGAPSADVAALLAISTARSFGQFRAALAQWRAPAATFLYADDSGNIGAISAGDQPVPRDGQPWLPMPGTGEYDVAGVIPYHDVPQAYNPPGHIIVAAGQRPVSGGYPYYLGPAGSFDPGYRAARISALLRGRSGLGPGALEALQADVTDPLAASVLRAVLRSLRATRLSALQARAARLLAQWDYRMTAASPGAAIWWTVWRRYISAVFGPWWSAGRPPASRIPVAADPSRLSLTASRLSLDRVLAEWTLTRPLAAAPAVPGQRPGTFSQLVQASFRSAVTRLRTRLGGDPARWTWGRLHWVGIAPLLLAPDLGVSPQPAAGDPWTVNAAPARGFGATGPSLRMIVGWAGGGRATAEVSFPGGQSGNPVSPWYRNLAAGWRQGHYRPLPAADSRAGRQATWRLVP
jgi:penicillin G amidase